ncbi:MAG: FecR domain-containing protein [Steroidobacteraceae bacterium]
MAFTDNSEPAEAQSGVEERAAAAVFRRQSGAWTADDQRALDESLADPAFAKAFASAAEAWRVVGDFATSPELMVLREKALGGVRRTHLQRWFKPQPLLQWGGAAAAVALLAVGLVASSLFDGVTEAAFETEIGEQRIVELEDHSRIALDAGTTLQVRFTRDSRIVELAQGQAQFMVAKDPRRPFRVHAGEHTITAVGTSFNVEYFDQRMAVAMVEGKVAVSIGATAEQAEGSISRVPVVPQRATTDLVAGEELRVDADGRTRIDRKADIDAVIAWRQGKIILKDTPLGEAVRRLNRYSRLQVRIGDESLAALRVSGVFESGDTLAFVEALQSYLPVVVYRKGPDLLSLSPRQ